MRYSSSGDRRLHPDSYGCWEDQGRAVRFFLEHDTGTESLTKVVRKIDEYRAFPTDAFGILLFSVHSSRREIALRTALGRDLTASDPGFVIATAVRDHGHADGPAGPIWGLWTFHGGDTVSHRYRLAELPERGPVVEHDASRTNLPFSEAAFDPDDREIVRRIEAPQPERVVPEDYPDDLTTYDDAEDNLYQAPTWPTIPHPQRNRWAA